MGGSTGGGTGGAAMMEDEGYRLLVDDAAPDRLAAVNILESHMHLCRL